MIQIRGIFLPLLMAVLVFCQQTGTEDCEDKPFCKSMMTGVNVCVLYDIVKEHCKTMCGTCTSNVYCPDITTISHGDAIMSSGSPYKVGTTATFVCDIGYRGVGEDNITCLSSGKWSNDIPVSKPECPSQFLDLMFVLDGSGSVNSIDPRNFGRVKDWVKRVSSAINWKGFVRIGVIQYSHWYSRSTNQPFLKTEIELGQHDNYEDFKAAVDNIKLQGYTTFTAHAINYTVEYFKASERFNDTKKVMILLTDGRSNDFKQLPQSAGYARSMGIITFAVGVGDYDIKELQIIATGQDGNNERVYALHRFSDLQKIVGSLQQNILDVLEA